MMIPTNFPMKWIRFVYVSKNKEKNVLDYELSKYIFWLTEMRNFKKYLVSFFKIIILTLNMKELICPTTLSIAWMVMM